MSLRQLFSRNLQRLSRTRKSHAEVARAIGVNRQQYNNYLYGKNLPNELIVDRICRFFGIEHAELFRADSGVAGTIEGSQVENPEFVDVVLKHSRTTGSGVKPGWYHIIFRPPHEPSFYAIYAMQVRRRAGIAEFRRFSHAGLADSMTRYLSFHKGLVLESHNNIYLVSVDVFDAFSPTVLICRPVISKSVSYMGRSLVRVGGQDQIINFVIVPVREDAKTARHFKRARFYPAGEYTPDPEIVAILDSIR